MQGHRRGGRGRGPARGPEAQDVAVEDPHEAQLADRQLDRGEGLAQQPQIAAVEWTLVLGAVAGHPAPPGHPAAGEVQQRIQAHRLEERPAAALDQHLVEDRCDDPQIDMVQRVAPDEGIEALRGERAGPQLAGDEIDRVADIGGELAAPGGRRRADVDRRDTSAALGEEVRGQPGATGEVEHPHARQRLDCVEHRPGVGLGAARVAGHAVG